MAAKKQPANQPILMGDNRQLHPSWAAFFDSLVAEIEALKARLTAAGIP